MMIFQAMLEKEAAEEEEAEAEAEPAAPERHGSARPHQFVEREFDQTDYWYLFVFRVFLKVLF